MPGFRNGTPVLVKVELMNRKTGQIVLVYDNIPSEGFISYPPEIISEVGGIENLKPVCTAHVPQGSGPSPHAVGTFEPGDVKAEGRTYGHECVPYVHVTQVPAK